jgi:hypothetical protein
MEFFPPFTSATIWIICYFISLYSFSYIFSNKLIPKNLRRKTKIKTVIFLFFGTILCAPIIAGLSYRIGGIIEKGNNIPWGARIENFNDISIFLASLSLFFLFLLLIIALIKPEVFGFERRYKAIFLYIFHHIYLFILIALIGRIIPLIAGTLSRMNSTSGGFD